MKIPQSILDKTQKTPFDNDSFYHAEPAMKFLQTVNEESYIPDFFSMAINTLERFYKGFLYAAQEFDDTYQIPSKIRVNDTHNIWDLYNEIKKNYVDCFPYLSRSEYRELKQMMCKWTRLYSKSRYTAYPDYTEFQKLVKFTTEQKKTMYTYIKETNFEQGYARPGDYEDIE